MTTKLNRTQYKVLVESKEQAEQFKQVLLALGEPVFPEQNGYGFYNGGEPVMIFSNRNEWICVEDEQDRITISIKDLAKLIVNEVKPILTSVDGVDLYEGDEAHWVIFLNGGCKYLYQLELSHKHNIMLHSGNDTYRLFHSRQAAEAWIAEQNKPKSVKIELCGDQYIEVYNDRAEVYLKDFKFMLTDKTVNEMQSALKSLS